VYEQQRAETLLGELQSKRLAQLMHWALAEEASTVGPVPEPHRDENCDLPHHRLGSTKGVSVQTLHMLAMHILTIAGHLPCFLCAFFGVLEEELELEQLESDKTQEVNLAIGFLFAAVQSSGALDAIAWQALATVAEVKFVRRLMRIHTEVRGMFRCLLENLSSPDNELMAQIVCFLKQVFTGATDQFVSTEKIMFEHLGRDEGCKRLLGTLLKTCRENGDPVHRGNVIAFLADAMFFSSFTDVWQKHPQANDLIAVMFNALHWRGVEGTAGLALGNFVSANGHTDLILDHVDAPSSISDVGWFLRRTSPGWDTKMQIYYLWRVLRSPKGCVLLARHPHADLVIAGLIRGVRCATMEDNEVLGLLECFLRSSDTRAVLLRKDNVARIMDGICNLLSGGDPQLGGSACQLLHALLEVTGSSTFLNWHQAPRLVSAVSRSGHGRDMLDKVISLLQWEPHLVKSLSLEYKRDWISNRIHGTKLGEAVVISVHRDELLQGLLEGLPDPQALQHGLNVKFQGADETGSGDGLRRELFRLASAELTNVERGLFTCNNGGRSLHPSMTAPNTEPEYLQYFELLGKLIGLALLHRECLPAARFTPALNKMLMEVGPLDVEDMAAVDPDFYAHKVRYILDGKYNEADPPMTLEDLDLTFEDTLQSELFPDVHTELFPGGSKMRVTEDNKHHYIDLLCDNRMRRSVFAQVEALKRGFRSLIPDDTWYQMQRLVSPTELELLICGIQEVDVADWKANSVCAEGLEQETWDLFWSIAEKLTPAQQKELLEFVTGSPVPPVGGFASLPGYGAIGNIQQFTIARNLHSTMPVASTCFNTLYLPRYASEAEMLVALLEAIAHRDAGGFHEGAVVTVAM